MLPHCGEGSDSSVVFPIGATQEMTARLKNFPYQNNTYNELLLKTVLECALGLFVEGEVWKKENVARKLGYS